MNNPITTLTEEDVADAIQSAMSMALRFEMQRLSVIDQARAELALGEYASAVRPDKDRECVSHSHD